MDQVSVVTQIVSEKLVDVVGDAVAPVISVAADRSLRKKMSAFLKYLFLRCIHTSAVQVAHPRCPSDIEIQVPQSSPASEPEVENEPPPLEPSPEKV